MNKYELLEWIRNLPLQTLTEDLKETLIENIEDTIINEIINTH